MPPVNDLSDLRDSLTDRLEVSRRVTDSIFEILSPEALTDRPIPERHRLIFYLGHLEAFDWNLLGRSTLDRSPFNPGLDRLFAFGIDPVGDGLPDDSPADWPSLPEVKAYGNEVRRRVDDLLRAGSFNDTSAKHDALTVLNVAIEHRLMHAETLSYMLHWVSPERKHKTRSRTSNIEGRPIHGQVHVPAGAATLGLARNDGGFGWDNEFGRTRVEVPAFSIDVLNVTNGQYLDFVLSGGYEERSLWTEDDWSWVSRTGVRHPRFWERHGDRWMQRNMFETIPLPLDWPVYVSHAEGAAYARWAGKHLPTEAQLHRAAYGTPEGDERPYPWGWDAPSSRHGNFGRHQWDPKPVGAFPAGDSAFGVADLIGNGWEWTSTLFEPFDGFERFEFYPGYSADFFDGQHYVMKGGSALTDTSMLRRSFRNWFQPHYPHIYSSFRCVES